MATEKIIKGKRCKYYTNGYIWVSEDGTIVAIKQKSGYWKYFDIKTDGNGEKFVNTGYMTIYIKKAVFTCLVSDRISLLIGDSYGYQTKSCCWIPTAGFYLFLYLRLESIVIVVGVVIAIAICSGN